MAPKLSNATVRVSPLLRVGAPLPAPDSGQPEAVGESAGCCSHRSMRSIRRSMDWTRSSGRAHGETRRRRGLRRSRESNR